MPRKRKKQLQEYPVTVEFKGKRYSAFYTVSSGIVTVESDWGDRSAHASQNAQFTARQLFFEILREAKARSELETPGKE